MVYIKSLNKNIFPYYLPPEKEELLSSWICRLSYNHGVKTNTFIQNYFPNNFPIWNRDIDLSGSKFIITTLERHTPLNYSNIENLLLRSLQGYAFRKLNPKGITENILSIGIQHRMRNKFGQLCCQKCLDKKTIYYKKSWRLASSIVCSECNCLLIDRCPNCEAPITFFRTNMGGNIIKSTMEFKKMNLCSNCFGDLTKMILPDTPSPLEIEYQKFIDKTICNGYNEYTQYSFFFIKVLLILAMRLRKKIKNNRFKKCIEEYYNINFDYYKTNINAWDAKQRRETIPIVYSLFLDFPNKLEKILRQGMVTKSYLVKDCPNFPYWFEKILLF